MTDDEPTHNQDMIDAVEVSYSKAIYCGDNGMWTVHRIVKTQVAKVATSHDADRVIRALALADQEPTHG